MSNVKFSVQLFDTTGLAADGSSIPRHSCEEYLTSSAYHQSIADKTSIGGLTHKDRKLKPEYKGLIGMDDQVLINDNALFYITKLYFLDGSNFLNADAEFFNPDLFAGKRAENIYNLIGMMKSGVKFPVSVVIQALWSKRGTAEKIIKIKGFDCTLNPSFKGAAQINKPKFYSEQIEDKEICATEDEIKQFSDTYAEGGLELKTVVFSSDLSGISIEDDETINQQPQELFGKMFKNSSQNSNGVTKTSVTYSDIVSTYGQDSPQVKLITPYQGKILTKEDLYNIAKNNYDGEPDPDLDYQYEAFKKLSEEGDRDKLQVLFRSNRDKLQNIIHSIPKDDPNRNDIIRGRIENFFRVLPETKDTPKIFSTVGSVTERLRNDQQPRFTKINRIITSYQQSLKSKKFTDDKILKLKLMFIQDINLLIKEVLEDMKKGRTLDTLYALGRYGKDVKNSSIQLSKTYRKVLLAEQFMKFIPKTLYGEWIIDIQKFYQDLVKYTFGSELTKIQLNLINFK